MEVEMCPELPEDVKKLLDLHPSIQTIKEGTKLKCSLTGHEMPCTEAGVLTYVQGKKYKRHSTMSGFDYDKYKPHIVPSEKKWFKERQQLFCKLTLRHLNRDPHHVMRHINGKRYKRALVRWGECQKTGQVFKPRGGSANKQRPTSKSEDESSSEDEEEEEEKPSGSQDANTSDLDDGLWADFEDVMQVEKDEDTDDLDDLYPKEDFEIEESDGSLEAIEEDSDSEIEEIPEAVPLRPKSKPDKTNGNTTNKRKLDKQLEVKTKKAKNLPEKTGIIQASTKKKMKK